jgi:ketosteroid isomerase-like protein
MFATGQMFGQNVNGETEKEAVLKVMKTYKDALQNLTTEGTFKLFTKDSEVFESGGVEGSYANYIEHHLGPELGHFKKFEFSDYEIDVKVDTPYAFTTETYVYTIVLKADEKGDTRTIKKKGVATSILKKVDGDWKIIKTHSSSRNIK